MCQQDHAWSRACVLGMRSALAGVLSLASSHFIRRMNAPVRTRLRARDSMAPELRQLIQTEDSMVRQRHFARERHLPPTDQPHIGARVVGGATWAHRDEYTAVTGEIGDAMDAPGLERCRQGQRWQDAG